MAQISPFQLQVNPTSLAQLSKVRPDYMPDVWDWRAKAQQMDQTGLADLMRAAEHESAMDPGRLAQQEATLQGTLFDNAGKVLSNEGKVLSNKKTALDNELAQHLLPQKKITEFQELIKKASDADMETAENEIYKMLRSPDPKQQAIGKQLERGLKEAVRIRLQGDQQLRVQGSANAAAMARQTQQQAHQIELEKMRTDRALALQNMRDATNKAKLGAGADPKKWQELAVKLAIELRNTTDEELRQQLNSELQFAQQMAERLAPQPAPQIDPTKVGGGRLVPGREPMPNAPGVGTAKPDPLGIR